MTNLNLRKSTNFIPGTDIELCGDYPGHEFHGNQYTGGGGGGGGGSRKDAVAAESANSRDAHLAAQAHHAKLQQKFAKGKKPGDDNLARMHGEASAAHGAAAKAVGTKHEGRARQNAQELSAVVNESTIPNEGE